MATATQQARIEAAEHDMLCAEYDNAGQDALDRCRDELKAARIDAETIDQRCFRLGLMAADKDDECERHMAAEADAAGRAAGRRLAGNDDAMAASFDREAAACLSLAQDCMAEAERLRSQAGALRKAVAVSDALREIAGHAMRAA